MQQTSHMWPSLAQFDCLQSRNPSGLWKQNYHFNWINNSTNSLAFSSFSDRIEHNSQLQHQQIISEVTSELTQFIREGDFILQEFEHPLYTNLNLQNAQYFFDQAIELRVFNCQEAEELRQILSKRNDWRKLCIQLIKLVDPRYHCELAYVFYISIKLILDIKAVVRLTYEELGKLFDSQIQRQEQEIASKLTLMSLGSKDQMLLKKIGLSMMMAIYGIFRNPYCDRRSEKFKQFQNSINHQEGSSKKRSKVKVINLKPRPTRPRGLISQPTVLNGF